MSRMVQIADLIAELQGIERQFGNTCCFVGHLSWGSVALWDKSDEEQAGGKYGVITASKKTFHRHEPIFLLRSTDPLAPEAINRYAEACQLEGCELEHCAEVRNHASRMREWQKQHPKLVKPRPE